MKNRLTVLLTFTVLIFAISACIPRLVPRVTLEPDSGKPDSNIRVTESLELQDYSKIEFKGAGIINLVQGDNHTVRIEGTEAVLNRITSEVRNGVLIIEFESNFLDWIKDFDAPTFTITYKDLENFKFEGGGEITAKGLETDSLTVKIQGGVKFDLTDLQVTTLDLTAEGGGDITVTGVAATHKVKLAGGSNYDAKDLQSRDVTVKAEGGIFISVWATETLDLDLSGAYNVEYYGSPKVTQNVQGIGNIEDKGEK